MSIKRKDKPKTNDPTKLSVLELLKSKPGFVIAAIVFVILILIVFFTPRVNIDDGVLAGGYAKTLHENNQAMIEYYIEGIDTQLVGQYDDTISDDYLYSMQSDFVWLKNTENTIFSSKPSTDVLVKEMAFSYFLEEIAIVNDDFLFDFDSMTQSETIELAKKAKYVDKNEFSLEVEDIFSGEIEKKALFTKTYNDLMREYVNTKITLITNAIENERSFVEAKKVLLLTNNTK